MGTEGITNKTKIKKTMVQANEKVAQPSGRLTTKKLITWLNDKFKEFEIDGYEVIEVNRTHYSQDAYEGGASRLIVVVVDKSLGETNLLHRRYFNCFYTISQYQEYLNTGYELYIKDTGNFGLITDMEIEVRKISGQELNCKTKIEK